MKKLFGTALIVLTSIVGLMPLSAASERVKIVSRHLNPEPYGKDKMTKVTNVINEETSDLVKGILNMEITVDNTSTTEIMYVLDNSTKMTAKDTIIEKLNSVATALETNGNGYIRQGISVTTEEENSLMPLDSANISTQFDSVKEIESAGEETKIEDAITKAHGEFTDAANKVLVIVTADMPSEVENLTSLIGTYKQEGIQVIAYGIDLTDDAQSFTTLFTDGIPKTNDQFDGNEITTKMSELLPEPLKELNGTVTFDSYITDNFNITNVKTNDMGTAVFENNQITWDLGEVNAEQIAKLTYTLELKSEVDESIVDRIELRTNRQFLLNGKGSKEYNGAYPKEPDSQDLCSPVIMILKEAVDNPVNPDTGIANYLIFGSCLVLVGAVTLLVLKNKNEFNRI